MTLRHLYKFDQRNGGRAGCFPQISIQCGEWHSAITSELQISGIVDRQLRIHRRGEERCPRRWGARGRNVNGQCRQGFSELKYLTESDPLAPHCHDQRIHDLGRPVRWRNCFITRAQALEQRFGCGRRFVGETPRQRSRGVDYKDAQYFRPSLIRSLIETPPSVTPRRSCRIRSTASSGVIRFAGKGCSAASRSSARSTICSGEPSCASCWRSSCAWGVRVTVMSLNVARTARLAQGQVPLCPYSQSEGGLSL
jgi:hypothetical protein